MTRQGAETFVVALARASKRAKRYLRDLTGADRDDVLATAILWCWEHKADYSPSVSLDDWFVGAVRNARTAWERNEAHHAAELVEAIGMSDDTAWHTEVEQSMERLAAQMDATDCKIVEHCLKGEDLIAISARSGIPYRTVQRRLDRMRLFVPESQNFKVAIRKTQLKNSDHASDEILGIDREIERLEFAPPAGQNCRPCWRCKWFDGFLPLGRAVQEPMQIVEPEVRAAVLEIEKRKLLIAKAVRAGTINCNL